jgi:hypothetical protein
MTESIQDVKARYEQQVMETPGVTSMGIGRNAKGETAIIIGIEEDREKIRTALPKELDGHPVEIQVTGPVHAR